MRWSVTSSIHAPSSCSPSQCTEPRRTCAPADQRSTFPTQPGYQSHSKPKTHSSSGWAAAAASQAPRCSASSVSTTWTLPVGSMTRGSVRWSVDTSTAQPAAAAAAAFSSNVATPSEKRVWVWVSTIDPGSSGRAMVPPWGRGFFSPHCAASGRAGV